MGSGALFSLAAAATLFYADGGVELASVQRRSASLQRQIDEVVAPPVIRSKSSARAMEIARRLEARGAQFYGTYWCSHCRDQKETLGKEAMRLVTYNECDADGKNSKRAECKAVGVKGYPTWLLDGKLYPGERDLDGLDAMLKGEVASQEPSP